MQFFMRLQSHKYNEIILFVPKIYIRLGLKEICRPVFSEYSEKSG
jgi:hypothetical protein